VARLLADDKGTRFKIAFGMPSNAHEGMFLPLYPFYFLCWISHVKCVYRFVFSPDDGQRVILAALDIQRRLASLDTTASIGIACGYVVTDNSIFHSLFISFGILFTMQIGFLW
jgi:hypothetical protein